MNEEFKYDEPVSRFRKILDIFRKKEEEEALLELSDEGDETCGSTGEQSQDSQS